MRSGASSIVDRRLRYAATTGQTSSSSRRDYDHHAAAPGDAYPAPAGGASQWGPGRRMGPVLNGPAAAPASWWPGTAPSPAAAAGPRWLPRGMCVRRAKGGRLPSASILTDVDTVDRCSAAGQRVGGAATDDRGRLLPCPPRWPASAAASATPAAAAAGRRRRRRVLVETHEQNLCRE